MGDFHVSFKSAVRGHHVYKDVWNPVLQEELPTQQEQGNPEDRYAISVMKAGIIVGHVPKEISKICWKFIDREGTITCKITGRRLRSVLLKGARTSSGAWAGSVAKGFISETKAATGLQQRPTERPMPLQHAAAN